MTLILSGTNGLSDVDGSAATPAIRGTDTNTGIFFPAADTIGFSEGGAEVARFDSSGAFLAGLTSSTGTSPMRVQVKGAAGGANPLAGYSMISAFDEVSGHIAIASSSENSINISVDPQNLRASSSLQFSVDGSERMRITSGGDVGIGTSSPSYKLHVSGSGTITSAVSSSSAGAVLRLSAGGGFDNRIDFTGTLALKDDTAGLNRMYINSSGKVGFGTSSPDAIIEAVDSSTGGVAARLNNTNGSFTQQVLQVRATRNTTNETFFAIRYFNDGAGAYKFNVADSGNVTNTNGSYGTISDAKMKTDIVDAGSQWADIKAIRFRKFKMKDDPTGLLQLGVVAQELEQTSPGLVAEHKDVDGEGVDLGTTTKSVKTSILLMKAAVALQEAMARIEQLEAKVAALESGAK